MGYSESLVRQTPPVESPHSSSVKVMLVSHTMGNYYLSIVAVETILGLPPGLLSPLQLLTLEPKRGADD